jgi:hypothetical protein
MSEKNRVYKSEVIGLPPFKSVLGEVPSPNPDRRMSVKQAEAEMNTAIRKLIGYLKEEKGRAGYF